MLQVNQDTALQILERNGYKKSAEWFMAQKYFYNDSIILVNYFKIYLWI